MNLLVKKERNFIMAEERNEFTKPAYDYYVGREFTLGEDKITFEGLVNGQYEFAKGNESIVLSDDEARKVFSSERFRKNREKVNNLYSKIDEGTEEYFHSENKFRSYLDKMSVLKDKSARNTLLVLLQKPDATIVNTFDDWKLKYNRSIKKDEKAISVLGPVFRDVTDENGNTERKFSSMQSVAVFDVSQTDRPFAFHPPFRDMTAETKEEAMRQAAGNILNLSEEDLNNEDLTLKNLFISIGEANRSLSEVENYDMQDFIKEAAAYVALKTVGLEDTVRFNLGMIEKLNMEPNEYMNMADSIKSVSGTILNSLEKEAPSFFRKPRENTISRSMEKDEEAFEPFPDTDQPNSLSSLVKDARQQLESQNMAPAQSQHKQMSAEMRI